MILNLEVRVRLLDVPNSQIASNLPIFELQDVSWIPEKFLKPIKTFKIF